MGNQLKQALIDAGIVSKKDLEREKIKKRHVSKSSKIRQDQIRIVCEVCDKTAPDVERYQHKNRLITGKEWLCIPCADQYCIDDEFRNTHQSSHAKSGLFRRQYGRTKRF
jgi:thymidine kinase